MPRIYTRTGDNGTTSLIYGVRVPKNDPRVEAYGTVDEANSIIGLASSFLEQASNQDGEKILNQLHRIQTLLFHVGSELSTPEGKEVPWEMTSDYVKELEEYIDELEKGLPPLNNFILPGGHPAGAELHVARTVVRRAERRIQEITNVNPHVLSFMNRLSDYLFVAARYVNQMMKIAEKNLHQD